VASDLSGEWHVLGGVTEDFDAFYQVHGVPTADLVAVYNVSNPTRTDHVVDVFRYGRVGARK
jgi:hypothetical protein